MNKQTIRLLAGKHKGKWLCQAPKPYQIWLLSSCQNVAQIAHLDVRISSGEFAGRRISSLADWELDSLALDDSITVNEFDLIGHYREAAMRAGD
jgi:hypothetical protein